MVLAKMCGFSDALGIPGEGVHFHVGGIAIVDLILTILAAFWISGKNLKDFALAFVFLIVLGYTLHEIFCVPTTINTLLNSLI